MKSSAKKVELASVDDLFSTEEEPSGCKAGKRFRRFRCLNCMQGLKMFPAQELAPYLYLAI